MPDKKKNPSTDAPEDLSTFEEAFEKLESVVREMEAEELPLEKLIENYEAGTRFFQICQERLDEAQGRIDLIRKKANGEISVEPFDAESAANASGAASSGEPSGAAKKAVQKPSLKEDGELF